MGIPCTNEPETSGSEGKEGRNMRYIAAAFSLQMVASKSYHLNFREIEI